MPDHPIVHIEIAANDPGAAGQFYANLFGWNVQPIPEMNYVTFEAKPGPGGAFPAVDNETYKPGDVLVFVSTDDIDATLARAESLGGRTVVPKSEVPGYGWFGIFSDPTGNRIGLWTGTGGQG